MCDVCVYVCLCNVCVMYVCVYVYFRKRDREREIVREKVDLARSIGCGKQASRENKRGSFRMKPTK